MTAPSDSPRLDLWHYAALALLVALTGYTRLTAPWTVPLTNDEMKHLESWRNRYRTDDVYPLFLEKVERQGWFEGERLDVVENVYRSGPLAQRGFLVLVDGHPPVFPVTAEIIEAITRSSLVAVRLPSALASILTVVLMYLIGRRLRDPTLGLWLAGLLAIGFLADTYAGIARSYAMGHCALVLALFVFIRGQESEGRPPARFWLAALFAQATHWVNWVFMGPLVLIELGRRLRARQGLASIAGQTWWYAGASVLLLGLFAIQAANPTTREVPAPVGRALAVWYHLALASPFASVDHHLGVPRFNPLAPSGIALVLLVLLGAGAVFGDPRFRRPGTALALPVVRLALGVVLALSVLAPLFLLTGVRFGLFYLTPLTIFAGIGAHWVLRAGRASRIVLVLMLAAFAVMRAGWPPDPARDLFSGEPDYAEVAAHVRASLAPGDVWLAYPYFHGDPLYRYGRQDPGDEPLPEPARPLTDGDLEAFLASVPRSDAGVVFFGTSWTVERYRVLRRAPERRDFSHFAVVRIPPRPDRRGPP